MFDEEKVQDYTPQKAADALSFGYDLTKTREKKTVKELAANLNVFSDMNVPLEKIMEENGRLRTCAHCGAHPHVNTGLLCDDANFVVSSPFFSLYCPFCRK